MKVGFGISSEKKNVRFVVKLQTITWSIQKRELMLDIGAIMNVEKI